MRRIHPVHFGTDGWRAIMADSFTFERVSGVARAITTFLLKGKKNRPIVVGYDTRFLSDRFARRAAETAAATGAHVLLADRAVTTPMVSLAVKKLDAAGGIVVTASHNPPEYNGLKVKGAYGGPAVGDMIAKIESIYHSQPISPARTKKILPIKTIDLSSIYNDHLHEIIDFKKLARRGFRIAVDSMHGAGQGYLSRFCAGSVSEFHELRGDFNPGFGGVSPEPLEHKLDALKALVLEKKLDAGFAFDGDADRIAAVDEQGRYVDSHRIFALLLEYLWKYKKIRGKVGKTYSSTGMVEKIARDLGAEIKETPIGFKHICEQMLKGNVFIGGEESGGVGMKHHMMERDGFFCAMLLLEYCAVSDRALGALIDDLHHRYGPHHFVREDVHWDAGKPAGASVYPRLRKALGHTLASRKIDHFGEMDGLKLFFKGGDWLLFRMSGTEPTLRIYGEMSDREYLDLALKTAGDLIRSI